MRAFAFVLLLAACHEEPPIVIKFEPQDLSAKKVVADAAAPRAPVVDAGAAPKTEAECKAAADCGMIVDGCCDCNNGGKMKAATKAVAAAFKREARCRGMMCMHMISNDPTCAAKPDCVKGRCVLSTPPSRP